MKNIIVGTAGHIDHGKTTLIKALTGRNTDRWEEEQRRGITIDLGFTYFDLKNGDRVGIIDVPDRKNFINNMVAGVVGRIWYFWLWQRMKVSCRRQENTWTFWDSLGSRRAFW